MMIIDICVGGISIAFIILVVYLVITLIKVIEILKQMKRTTTHVDQLLKTANDLTLDFKKKSEILNIFFQPLTRLSKKNINRKRHNYEKIAEIIQFATEGLALLKTLKGK
jgi:uncharacterized protein YoxC